MVTRRNDERTVAGRHRMMRRADREVTEPQQIDAIIATCKIVSLAYTDAFEMATDCEVVEGRTLCNWGEAFKSIVGNGTASIIDDLDEARQGLALLMKQQAGMEHAEFTDQQVRAVTVWKVEADYLTAKVREKPQPHTH